MKRLFLFIPLLLVTACGPFIFSRPRVLSNPQDWHETEQDQVIHDEALPGNTQIEYRELSPTNRPSQPAV